MYWERVKPLQFNCKIKFLLWICYGDDKGNADDMMMMGGAGSNDTDTPNL